MAIGPSAPPLEAYHLARPSAPPLEMHSLERPSAPPLEMHSLERPSAPPFEADPQNTENVEKKYIPLTDSEDQQGKELSSPGILARIFAAICHFFTYIMGFFDTRVDNIEFHDNTDISVLDARQASHHKCD